jgi:hypothetical protein
VVAASRIRAVSTRRRSSRSRWRSTSLSHLDSMVAAGSSFTLRVHIGHEMVGRRKGARDDTYTRRWSPIPRARLRIPWSGGGRSGDQVGSQQPSAQATFGSTGKRTRQVGPTSSERSPRRAHAHALERVSDGDRGCRWSPPCMDSSARGPCELEGKKGKWAEIQFCGPDRCFFSFLSSNSFPFLV